jgi:hypothetical protein
MMEISASSDSVAGNIVAPQAHVVGLGGAQVAPTINSRFSRGGGAAIVAERNESRPTVLGGITILEEQCFRRY